MHMSDKYLYTATDTSAMGQYWLKISANQYLGQALNSPLTYRARVTASLLPSRLERGPEILNNRKKNNKNNRISLCSLSHHSFPFDPFHTSGVWMKIISGWNEKLTTYSLPQSLSSSIHIPSCYRKKKICCSRQIALVWTSLPYLARPRTITHQLTKVHSLPCWL